MSKAYIFGDEQIKKDLGLRFEEYLVAHSWTVTREHAGKGTPKKWTQTTYANKIREAVDLQTRLIIVNLGANNRQADASSNKQAAKALGELLLEVVGDKDIYILWLGPPPRTTKGTSSTVKKKAEGVWELNTGDDRYIKGKQVADGLAPILGPKFAFVDPNLNWETYLPVYATLPADQSDKDKWVSTSGTLMKEYGAYEYIHNIVKNWKSIFPGDPN